MFILTNPAGLDYGKKTISWYDSLDVMPNDILLYFYGLFFLFSVFCLLFLLYFCFLILLFFCCYFFVYLFVFLCQSNCIANPCKNNATCQSGFTDKGYRCLCSAGFKGQTCDGGYVIL